MTHVAFDEPANRLAMLCDAYLRSPVGSHFDAGRFVFEFDPSLTAPEQATYNRLRSIAYSNLPSITPAEWQGLEADVALLKTYQNVATPTLAQTVAATKAQSRILRAILRD
jgi:hypothetical protein